MQYFSGLSRVASKAPVVFFKLSLQLITFAAGGFEVEHQVFEVQTQLGSRFAVNRNDLDESGNEVMNAFLHTRVPHFA